MEIQALKEKLGDEMFAQLSSYVDELKSKVDEARSESINGRKGLKSKVETLESAQRKLLEKLGIDSPDDVDSLPDAKGAAAAAEQYAAKLKRAERELADAQKARVDMETKLRQREQRIAVNDALGKHEFLARDVVESYVSQRLVWEGDEMFFKSDDGKLVSVQDGVAGVAKSRPELLRSAGTGGAGIRQPNAGSGQGKTMARADFEQLSPAARVQAAKEGVTLT